eukprot:1047260-Pelagomonas_calceolata.AAC.2
MLGLQKMGPVVGAAGNESAGAGAGMRGDASYSSESSWLPLPPGSAAAALSTHPGCSAVLRLC